MYHPLSLVILLFALALPWHANAQSDCGWNPDYDGDNQIGVADLLGLLGVFSQQDIDNDGIWDGQDDGIGVEDECGGSTTVDFAGHTYDLVAIGDQCWFAENLRSEHYANGDVIPGNLSDSEWTSTTSGAQTVYGEGSSAVYAGSDDEVVNLATYGRLYNWYAVDDARGICPSGWHVPTDEEWMILEMELGLSSSEANSTGWRGTDQGAQMKSSTSDSPSWNGTNVSGFSALPGGWRYNLGYFNGGQSSGVWWSATLGGALGVWGRRLDSDKAEVNRSGGNARSGHAVRCVGD